MIMPLSGDIKMYSWAATVFLIVLLKAPGIWAQSSNLEAHVHGEAELLIAIEGLRIEMQLSSPAVNILGFEHEPTNEDQRERVSEVQTLLGDADALFEFEGTNCIASPGSVELPYADSHQEETHQDSEHAEHEDHESHSEVTAQYVFECDDSPTALIAKLLVEFPAIESLEAQWVADTGQGAQELSNDRPKIDLR